MKNAIDKIDRFLERYKQLCLEEGLFIETSFDCELKWVSEDQKGFEDFLEDVRNKTIDSLNSFHSSNKWRELGCP